MECDINRGGIDNFLLMEIFNIFDRMIDDLYIQMKDKREKGRMYVTYVFFIFFFLVAKSYNKDTRKRSIFNYW